MDAPRRTAGRGVVLAAAVALLVLVASAAAAQVDAAPPDVEGRSLEDAVAAILAHQGDEPVDIVVVPEPPPGLPDDLVRVVTQLFSDPADTVAVVPPEWTLELGTVVPDLSGLDVGSALQQLADRGLEALVDDDGEVVAGTDPPAGQLVAFGTPVRLRLEPVEEVPPDEPAPEAPPDEGPAEPPADEPAAEAPLPADQAPPEAPPLLDPEPGEGGGTDELAPALPVASLLVVVLAAWLLLRGRRARRQRAWVRDHVAVRPRAGAAHWDVDEPADAPPSTTVRLEAHVDPGRTELTEVP